MYTLWDGLRTQAVREFMSRNSVFFLILCYLIIVPLQEDVISVHHEL